VVSHLSALHRALARIGTTLDETTTCEELTRQAARQTGGTAAGRLQHYVVDWPARPASVLNVRARSAGS
jgi:precorrin-6B methylase 1